MNWSLQLNPESQTFKDKQKDLFAELDKVKTTIPLEKYIDHKDRVGSGHKEKSSMKTYKGKKSIFKTPEAPIRRCLPSRRRPDYQINPKKWTKYTLNDVRDEDMSERANKSAALSFLKEIEKRKEEEETEKKCESESICFKKSAMISIEKNEDVEKNIFENSKLVMPEYVIGEKVKKEKRGVKKENKGFGDKELKLSHLMQEDQDEEENT
ncbi:U5 small nuclear ribonucleoprotein TSSC4 [Onthophagus taurus]|uniref:U5 small nuclear ribonucleoprotein TSSC4 n=1 Tax=Onthophagus taurus TaxID=166361 RepID=UPI000C20F8EB|nr:uncharacterized protein LOC111424762 [Onthophagus taurus]